MAAHHDLAIITDLDGTISPIVGAPERAVVLPSCREALRRLSSVLPLVACLSGRRAADAATRIGVPSVIYVGNHGLERLRDGRLETDTRAEAWVPVLDRLADRIQSRLPAGTVLEAKGVSFTVHFRNAAEPDVAGNTVADVVRQAVAEARVPLRVRHGRMVIEVLPDVPVHKGTAVAALLLATRVGGVVSFGDDRTDLDVFHAVHQWGRERALPALCVAVGGQETPPELLDEADVVVSGPHAVCRRLTWLAARAGDGGGAEDSASR